MKYNTVELFVGFSVSPKKKKTNSKCFSVVEK